MEVFFDASSSSDSDGSIISYDWNFADGPNGSGVTTSHVYETAGDYTVQLTITDNDSASDSVTMDIEVISGTQVGGIISENTTWTKQGSPYVVTDTVQIPTGIKLTIDPGVTISRPSPDVMFLINGEIYAHGTPTNRIFFDGGNNSNFFTALNSNIDALFLLDLEYCTIKNGNNFFHLQGGSFSLKHCILENIFDYSWLWYPEQDIYIEYNKFINAGKFSIGHRGDVRVYIRYNLFDGLPIGSEFCIKNWAAKDSSQTIVQYNSFINMNGIVLKLPYGCNDAAMSAPENYWGTQDISAIEGMIYDKNDDITCAGYIQYEPILTEPHLDVPQ